MSLKPYKLASLKDKIEAIEEKSLESADKVEPAEVKKPRKTKKGMNKGNSTLTVISAVALAFVVALGVSYFGATPKGDKGDSGTQGIQGTQGLKGDKGTQGLQGPQGLRGLPGLTKFGATPGPDFYGLYLGNNDVRTYATRLSLTTATNTPCIIRAPLNATSTLISGSYGLNTATSAIMLVGFARDISTARAGGGGFATGTQVLGGTRGIQIAANDRVNLIASTTPNDTPVFGPGDYFVVKSYGGANNGYYNHVGTCEAVFQEF